jgi:2-polyprenyl-3-methyl-5-hydroxy-6-metoxy-1,4-benzoquinol methylase
MNAIHQGKYVSHWFRRSPRRMLYALAYYRFAASLIGSGKKVLDIGCSEGVGTWLLAKECGYAMGVDFDDEAIASAKQNYHGSEIEFYADDFLRLEVKGGWDAVVNFDVIEHIEPAEAGEFLQGMSNHLKPDGIAIIGTPSEISQQFALPISKRGHVNIYTAERLESEMKQYFSNVFLFSANDEVVHTGFASLAHYFFAVGCKKRMK